MGNMAIGSGVLMYDKAEAKDNDEEKKSLKKNKSTFLGFIFGFCLGVFCFCLFFFPFESESFCRSEKRTRRAGHVAQLLACLSYIHKALGLALSTT